MVRDVLGLGSFGVALLGFAAPAFAQDGSLEETVQMVADENLYQEADIQTLFQETRDTKAKVAALEDTKVGGVAARVDALEYNQRQIYTDIGGIREVYLRLQEEVDQVAATVIDIKGIIEGVVEDYRILDDTLSDVQKVALANRDEIYSMGAKVDGFGARIDTFGGDIAKLQSTLTRELGAFAIDLMDVQLEGERHRHSFGAVVRSVADPDKVIPIIVEPFDFATPEDCAQAKAGKNDSRYFSLATSPTLWEPDMGLVDGCGNPAVLDDVELRLAFDEGEPAEPGQVLVTPAQMMTLATGVTFRDTPDPWQAWDGTPQESSGQ